MKLVIEDDDGRQTVVPIAQDEISIGREPGNTVRLTERNVSRRHAVLVRESDAVIIEDLDSFNGVRVNGQRIEGRQRINRGDLIQIGDYDLALQDETQVVMPDRPTQPNLTPVPGQAGQPRGEPALPFQSSEEAVARFRKASAIQALFVKGASSTVGAPLTPAVGGKEQWPADFHFVAPGTVQQLASDARRKRYIFGLLFGSIALFVAVLGYGFLRPRPPSPLSEEKAGVRGPVEAPAPLPAVAEPAPPGARGPAEAPAPVPAVAEPAPPYPLSGERAGVRGPAEAAAPVAPAHHLPAPVATHRKALDLYQDAEADIGNGDYSGALAKLQASLGLDPTSPEAHKQLAICFSHLHQPGKGVYHFEQYLKLKPEAADADDVRKMLSEYRASKGAE